MELRKRTQALLLLIAISAASVAQGTVVTGIIHDNRAVPITGATICQVNTSNCTVADMNGIFHLLLEPGKELNLQVECLGYNPVEVVIDESTTYPLKVNLTPIYIPDDIFLDEMFSDNSKGIIIRSSITMDVIFTDFVQFTPSLGLHNTELMKSFGVIGPELGASFSRVYFGLGIGMGYNYKDDTDTLIVDLKNSSYKINFGYDLMNSGRIRLTPLISMRWLRYRLMNYPADRKITLTSYLDERDIELRFNQTVAVASLNMDYIMYSGPRGSSDYWSLGVTGGYAMKLNRIPWVYSRGNRVMTDNMIGLNHLTFSIAISYYTIVR